MMGRLGAPEIVIALIVSLLWLLPVMAAAWALLTLGRMRRLQEEMVGRLASIERLLQPPRD